ncbi:LysE family translocator [Pseudonocardia sp. TRM90224]|uniref:LysE family translocator n=1 Tax=Pseudonocardia sp. TRM90224 TaxID=2812678 RepID=UPI001E43E564|nr:LysE family translocator [Pseudonocardia sp. TRM90224]
MTLDRWLAFLGVLVVVLCTPGPDFAVVLRHALRSPRRGALAAAGVVCGLGVHTTAAGLGLSALVTAHPDVLVVIRYAGAAYLVWLGVQAIRAAIAACGEPTEDPPGSARPFVDGFAGNLLNPKALLFFLGLIPQFVVPGPAVTAQILVLAGSTVAASVVWWSVVVLLAAQGRAAMRRRPVRRSVDGIAGTALIGVAIGVATAA